MSPFEQKIYHSILDLIGNTPLIQLHKIVPPGSARILAKLESFNPGGSVKDRICLKMIEMAESEGALTSGGVIIEPSSGNTGIGIAMVAAVKGYRCIVVIPESMSLERQFIIKSYGAEVVLTASKKGMSGAIQRAKDLLAKTPNSFMPSQFMNQSNLEAHRQTTAKELMDATNGKIDAFVVGVGTGGTLSGAGEVLKKANPDIQIVAVEPEESAVISGKKSGTHKIQGIGAGFIPEILNRDLIDRIVTVKDAEAFETAGLLAREEGLFMGISSGAAVWASLKIAEELGAGKTLVTVLPDTGERYFSTQQYFEV